jgi:hypothetical protein
MAFLNCVSTLMPSFLGAHPSRATSMVLFPPGSTGTFDSKKGGCSRRPAVPSSDLGGQAVYQTRSTPSEFINPSDFKVLAEGPVRAAQQQIHEFPLIENSGAVELLLLRRAGQLRARLEPHVEGVWTGFSGV